MKIQSIFQKSEIYQKSRSPNQGTDTMNWRLRQFRVTYAIPAIMI